MSDSIISQLFDFGALGAFAAFLVWQHLGMQKRLDSLTEKFQEQMAGLVNKFQSQLKEIEDRHEARIEIMRGRYDDVIEGYRTEALDCQKQMAIHRQDLSKVVAGNAEALSEHTGLLQDIGGEVSAGLHEMREQHKEMEIERRAKRPGKSS
jgi:hypothetical protein